MATFAVLQDLSAELRRQIFDALESTSDTDFGLAGSIERITLKLPAENTPGEVVASLYLYHLDINGSLRNQPMLPDRTQADQFRSPPLPLKLRYLFTPIGDDEGTNQLLIGRVLQHFNDHPTLDATLGTPVGDSFGGASSEVRVRPDPLTLEQLSQFWSAASRPYRVGISLLVEVVAIDSATPPVLNVRVSQLVTATGLAARP